MARTRVLFKLTKPLMLRLKAKGQYKEKCHNCGKTFKPGNIILSKMTRSYSHHSGRKWYCKKCAKKLKLL